MADFSWLDMTNQSNDVVASSGWRDTFMMQANSKHVTEEEILA